MRPCLAKDLVPLRDVDRAIDAAPWRCLALPLREGIPGTESASAGKQARSAPCPRLLAPQLPDTPRSGRLTRYSLVDSPGASHHKPSCPCGEQQPSRMTT